ncbi:hypothetical protein H4R33_005114 [Dimargaris cristalligena]|nr:hypothetical protein H4R33_005114 [Dimargaris cristalligena]
MVALVKHLNPKLELTESQLGYGPDPSGSTKVREQIADMVNSHFAPVDPVLPAHITVHNGTTSAIDIFSYVTCDPGEGIMIAAPYYGGFDFDTFMRAKAPIVEVSMAPADMLHPERHVELMEAAYQKAVAEGILVRSIIFTNPHNPLGQCHPRALIENLLRFANRYNLHILFDEIYALSVFNTELNELVGAGVISGDEETTLQELEGDAGAAAKGIDSGTEFHSVLSYPHLADLIDPSLVHVIHGMSKDFCFNGLRIGYLISPWNSTFINAVKTVSAFTWFSGTTEHVLTQFFSDPAWVAEFIQGNRRSLAQAYLHMARFLKRQNIPFIPSRAGHFIWVNLRRFCCSEGQSDGPGNEDEKEEEVTMAAADALFDRILDAGVYIAPGIVFHTHEPGWFRISFAAPQSEVDVGLTRLLKALAISG